MFTFKARKLQTVPGTNHRRYKKRDASELIRKGYPERRIIDHETWHEVQRLGHLRQQLTSPDVLDYLYTAIRKQLGELSVTANA